MEASDSDNDYEFHIEPTSQKPGLWNLYTQLTFCYPLPDQSQSSRVVETLNDGLRQLSAHFPWTAGQVIKQTQTNNNNNENDPYFMIRPYKKTPTLVVKDLSKTLPPFEQYQKSNFPINQLDENDVAPRNTKSESDENDPKPVLLLQLTFVTGGFFLTFAAQHGTMDIVGQGEVIRLLSKACHHIPFEHEEVRLGNLDRRDIVVPSPGSQHQHQHQQQSSASSSSVTTNQSSNPPSSPPPPATQDKVKTVWSNFNFSPASLQTLKQRATATCPPTCEFVSTDDSLSAFIWQSVSRARLPRFTSDTPTNTSTTCARTLDLRAHLALPSTYPGNLATKTHITNTFTQLVTSPLGVIAAQLRSSITLTLPSAQTSPPPRHRDLSRDLALSSWAKLTYCHDLDFNFGMDGPVAVVRPAFAPVGEGPMQGIVYLLPKGRDGGIVVSICLRVDDLQRLREDEEWRDVAREVG